VYVGCEATNEVVAVDTAAFKVLARIQTGPRPRAIAFDSDGATGFVSNENGAAVTVFDPATHQVTATIAIPRTEGTPTPPRPMGLALSPDGRHMFVSLGRAKSVGIIDVATRTLVRTIEDVGMRPWGIGVSADGRRLYTANGPSGDISIVDVGSGATEQRIQVGGSPWGIAVATARP
jgi:YVTN family beta-propeller protein